MTRHFRSNKDFKINNKLTQTNDLQAAVLGANDGIISIAALVIGVAGADQTALAVLITGISGIVAGAVSIAVGEYVSVSARRDFEEATLAEEKIDLIKHPKEELEDLVQVYQAKGLSHREADLVARELTKANAFTAHAEADFKIDPKHLSKPVGSALFSAGSFIIGATVPLLAITIRFGVDPIMMAFGAVILALIITGLISAKITGSNVLKPTARIVIGGAIAMAVAFLIGGIFKTPAA